MRVKFRQRLQVAGRDYAVGEEAEVDSNLARQLAARGTAEFIPEQRLRQPQQNRIRRPKQNRSA
jgi:hypothetical protein